MCSVQLYVGTHVPILCCFRKHRAKCTDCTTEPFMEQSSTAVFKCGPRSPRLFLSSYRTRKLLRRNIVLSMFSVLPNPFICSNSTTQKTFCSVERNGSTTQCTFSSVERKGSTTQYTFCSVEHNGSTTQCTFYSVERYCSTTQCTFCYVERNCSKTQCTFCPFERYCSTTQCNSAL